MRIKYSYHGLLEIIVSKILGKAAITQLYCFIQNVKYSLRLHVKLETISDWICVFFLRKNISSMRSKVCMKNKNNLPMQIGANFILDPFQFFTSRINGRWISIIMTKGHCLRHTWETSMLTWGFFIFQTWEIHSLRISKF